MTFMYFSIKKISLCWSLSVINNNITFSDFDC